MKKRLIWVIFVFIFLQLSGFIYGAIPAEERAALIALYNSTNGDNWTNKNGWKTPPLHTDGFAIPGTEGSWYGITLTGDNIYGLILEENNLSGSIPSQLGNLSFLAGLDLSENKLSSSIPSQLINLINLQYLDLYHNELSGSIPSQLGNLSNLRFLSLAYNKLSGSIPLSFINLNALDEFEIDHNCLYATDPTLRAWLDSNQSDWESNQNQCGIITLPTITTNSVSFITQTSAKCVGNVISDGGATVTARGVCWSTTSNPTTGNSKTTNGSGTGSFTSSITGLNANTKYYVRAYATNSIGTAYGSNVDFTTGGTTPVITVTSPNGGEYWLTGSAHSITWTSSGTVGNVKIMYTTNNGSSWQTITPSTTNNGLYPWTIPNTVSSQCKVKISEASDDNPSDTGDSVFSIISESHPTIRLNRTKLNFNASKSGATTGSQQVWIDNSGDGNLNWQLSTDSTWIICTPMSGTNKSIINVSVNTSGLNPGAYSGKIMISDANATNSPQTITVNLLLKNSQQMQTPFGDFAMPIDGSTVSSSLPVTGWALDDIEVTNVKIYNSETFIGDAVFIEGARPDIELAYPGYPMNYKAGWGYMLLTNFLPGGGNGSYTIHARAIDKEGNEVTLDSKTIYCDNAHAVKPFGAIDTPLQGGMASGKNYVNYGWLLTPVPNYIPANGSTISVFVDGVNLGHPTYNIFRADIANLFPGYSNSFGAVGYYYLDTTKLTDGIHTIFWIATDSGGNSDGIGSRYFSVLNTGGTQQSKDVALQDTVLNKGPDYHTLLKVNELSPVDDRPIGFRQGNDLNSQLKIVSPGNDGIINIETQELERVEIHLEGAEKTESLSPCHSSGYLIVGDEWRELPIGSTLDAARDIFYWQPGPGFIGEYRLFFVTKETNGEYMKRYITVTITPRFKK